MPIQKKIDDYLSHPTFLLDTLRSGAHKASQQAEDTAKEVREKLGLEFKPETRQKLKIVS